MASEDRVEKFISWARHHKYASIIILASMLAASGAQVIQSVGTVVEFIRSFRHAPPPVTVDFALGTSADRKMMHFRATVINVSSSPIYLQCVGLHVDDEGFIEHIWMEGPSHTQVPLGPGAKAVYSRAIERTHLDYEKRADYSDIWLTVESNSESIFRGDSLKRQFRDLWMFLRLGSHVTDRNVIEIKPTLSLRLKESVKHREASTFNSCTMEKDVPRAQQGAPADG